MPYSNNSKHKHLTFSLTLTLLLALSLTPHTTQTIVLTNGKIFIDENSFQEAVVISQGKITFVGTTAAALLFAGSSAKQVDLHGKVVLPGLHDVHMHPLEAYNTADFNEDCALEVEETDFDVHVDQLIECKPKPNSNGWITSNGHDLTALLEFARENDVLPRELLDAVSKDVPIVIIEATSHSIWVNSKTLEMMKITKDSKQPNGGYILKDEEGNPNGILLDNAGDEVIQVAIRNNDTIYKNNYEGLKIGMKEMNKYGLTAIVEGRTYWKRSYIEIWKELQENGLLTMRVTLTPWLYPGDDDTEQIKKLKSFYEKSDDVLKVNQLKVYSDGIVSGATAALLEPYVDNLGLPFNKGLNYFDETRLTRYVTELEEVGFDFLIHCIGDRGTREALNAIERARKSNPTLKPRHRLTHLEIVNSSDLPRFKELDVIADVQVAGPFTEPDNWEPYFGPLIGKERSKSIVPLKDLNNAGARITLSSDYDVSELNPFWGMANAVSRKPQNLETVAQAVKAYTINAAYCMRNEDITGSITVGKYADLIIIDTDVFTAGHEKIRQTKVHTTVFAGKVVYSDGVFDIADAGFLSVSVSGVSAVVVFAWLWVVVLLF